jgi:peptidoglycan/LPS O-acetylase OafA/YrhL
MSGPLPFCCAASRFGRVSAPPPRPPGRNGGVGYMPQLDGLRCFAVLGVLVTHAWAPGPLPWIFDAVNWGGLGVLLFFVLSGFLITGI